METAPFLAFQIFELDNSKELQGEVLLSQAAFLVRVAGVGTSSRVPMTAGADDVHEGSGDTLGEDQVDGFPVDEDVKHGGDHHQAMHLR